MQAAPVAAQEASTQAVATSTPSAPAPTVVLAAVGDIRLDGPIGDILKAKGWKAPAEAVASRLKADLLFGNLECPITQRGKKFPKKWNFRAPAANLRALKELGFDVLNLANNHIWDYGEQGFLDTLAAVDKAGFSRVGAGRNLDEAMKPVFKTVNGIKIGFLGFTSTFPDQAWAKKKRPGVAYSDFGLFPEVIRRVKKDCDVLVVSLHGGVELDDAPNEVQKDFGKTAVDAGADVVIGHHPHVIQPVEIYKGKPILYSIGNFLFVSPTPKTRWTTIAKITLGKDGVKALTFVPVDINYGMLKPAAPEGAQYVGQALNRLGAAVQSALPVDVGGF